MSALGSRNEVPPSGPTLIGEGEAPGARRARRIAARIRSKDEVHDREFDDLYPLTLRGLSRTFWTPIEVALRAAQLLVAKKRKCRVLDVGSGAGKFCILGSLSTRGTFVGIEQRAELVSSARGVADLLQSRATFEQGLFAALDPKNYDAFYFFNPFEENLWPKLLRLDWNASVEENRFGAEVLHAQDFLRNAKRGARVVTYNGMGGPIPSEYELVQREEFDCPLELWVKRS